MALTAGDVHRHLRAVGSWVDWEGRTPDGFKYGDPNREVTGIAVGWQSLQSALEEAHAKGLNLFITHEPTFYSHMDDDQAMRRSEPALRKMAFLDRTGMVVYRCHDVWDLFPGLGIVDAWSQFLGLGQPVQKARYYNLHRVPPISAWELAQRIAHRVETLGQQSVQFIGARWQTVSRLAVGTGAITNVRSMADLGADVLLTTDDGMAIWRDGAWVADLGLPTIIVNHMTAEVPGLRKLAEYLGQQFPDVPVEFVGPTCSYEILATERARSVGIRMRRDDLSKLDLLSLPEGYVHRPMKAGQAWAYLRVMDSAFPKRRHDQAWFDRTFSSDPEYDPSYLQIIWKEDLPVAVAAAWHTQIDSEPWGLVHWLGVADTERGKGLGRAVAIAALRRLRERGYSRAMLDTESWRLPAVSLYLSLGFEPWPVGSTPPGTWDRIHADLEACRREGRLRREGA